MERPLFLRRRRLIRLRLGPLLPNAHQPRCTPRLPKRPIRILCPLWNLTSLNLPNRHVLCWINDGHVLLHEASLLGVFLDVFLGGVHFFELARLAGEDDEALAVGL